MLLFFLPPFLLPSLYIPAFFLSQLPGSIVAVPWATEIAAEPNEGLGPGG